MSDARMHVTTPPVPDNVTSAANYDDDHEVVEGDNFSADRRSVYILAATFLACSIVAPLLVAVFADPLSR